MRRGLGKGLEELLAIYDREDENKKINNNYENDNKPHENTNNIDKNGILHEYTTSI